MTKNEGYAVQQLPTSAGSDYETLHFVINQFMAGVRTAVVVMVKAVYNQGGVESVGQVDIQPLVTQVDSVGNMISHGVIYNAPYFRVQGGENAIIIDPKIGDIGIAVISDRDISAVQSSLSEAVPGSARRFDMSDAIYLGGILNGVPQQYVRFSDQGIELLSPHKINLSAPEIVLNASQSVALNSPQIAVNGALSQGAGSYGGDAKIAGHMQVNQEITLAGIALSRHQHGDVQNGDGTTGVPING